MVTLAGSDVFVTAVITLVSSCEVKKIKKVKERKMATVENTARFHGHGSTYRLHLDLIQLFKVFQPT